MCKIYLIAACLFLFSCTETRTEKQVETQRNNDVHLSGSISLPIGEQGMFVPLPFNFTLEHNGTESQSEKGQQETKINAAAIGQQLGDAAATAIRTAIAGATGIKLPESKAGGGLTAGETGGAVATATALAYALQQTLERRNQRVVLDQVKRERADAQEKALRYAERVEPSKLNKDMEHA